MFSWNKRRTLRGTRGSPQGSNAVCSSRRALMLSSPVDRRQFLASGLTLAGATLLGCSADQILSPPLSAGMQPDQVRALDGDLSEPEVIRSNGGILTTGITCGTTPAFIAGRRVHQPV